MSETYEASGALVVAETRPLATATGVVPIVSPEEARASMEAYTALVNAVIGGDDYQEFSEKKKVDGKWTTTTKRFKKKSAVKKLQTFFGFSVAVISSERDDLGDGNFAFRVTARATSPNGRFVEAMAGCSTMEERFVLNPFDDESEQRFAIRQRKALARSYHDVLSTAETRATNRAAMNLIGAGEVTAEEIQRPKSQPAHKKPEPTLNAALNGSILMDRAVKLTLIPQRDKAMFIDWVRERVAGCADIEVMTAAYAEKVKAHLDNEEMLL